jgi:hypothetical protein
MVDLNSGRAIVQVREVTFNVHVQTLRVPELRCGKTKEKILKHACLLPYDI